MQEIRFVRLIIAAVVVAGLVNSAAAQERKSPIAGVVNRAVYVVDQVAPLVNAAAYTTEAVAARMAVVGPALYGLDARLALVDAPLERAAAVLAAWYESVEPSTSPRISWAQEDPADSLYREARQALNRGAYSRAAELFQEIIRRFPGSNYAPDAYYWQAFALYRSGSTEKMGVALRALEVQKREHPNAATRSDADVLATRIRGELAQRGDAESAAQVAERALPPPALRGARPPRPPRQDVQEEDDIRIAALNALLQMDASNAIPILKQILAMRDERSVDLRRKAVFLVSQKRSDETADILLDAARNDPDSEVRAQAVFWLSQVRGEKAVAALDSILLGSTDREVQKKAVFALSQHRSDRAARALKDFVQRNDVDDDLRADAIFWLGQHRSSENMEFLKQLYPSLESQELKEKVIFAVAQRRGAENQRWLLDLALDQSERLEMRKKALFWAGQSRAAPIEDLVRLYDTMDDREMREQLIFVYAQRREAESVDQLMNIARNDPDPELKRKALFWLGQSKDPRVPQFLLELISREP